VLRKVLIRNYRVFKDFELDLRRGVNVLIGKNDAGKSTLFEAINLAFTFRLHNSPITAELSPYLFNWDTTQEYVKALRAGDVDQLPEITIEVYLDDIPMHASLIGSNNLAGEDAPGVRIKIFFDEDYREDYVKYVSDPAKVSVVPTECYRVEWLDFGGNPIRTTKHLPDVSLIDASAIRLQNGADYHLQQIIGTHLDAGQRVELARSYRTVREDFASLAPIAEINRILADGPSEVSDRTLSLAIDISQRTTWERTLVPHLDQLPFQFAGKGEQSMLKILLALSKPRVEDSPVILVEEPENHLSFANLNVLMERIGRKGADKQMLVSTHDSFVLNKLGLGALILLTRHGGTRLTDLPSSTVDYFKKLPGFDTLRIVLAEQVILVEGPSDELVVQRAYRDAHQGRLPLQDGIDVICVDGLTAKRFLDIAVPLQRRAVVVTDNDGDVAKAETRYQEYAGYSFIRVYVGQGAPKTLEPQLLEANGLAVMNTVLGKSFATDDELLEYMAAHKTDCALKIFESPETITMPEYIRGAVA
jgi:putative ATP-dependent endonuclease of the OLD family